MSTRRSHANWDTTDHWSMFLDETTPDGLRTESIQVYRFQDRWVLFVRGYTDGQPVEVAVPLTSGQLDLVAVAIRSVTR